MSALLGRRVVLVGGGFAAAALASCGRRGGSEDAPRRAGEGRAAGVPDAATLVLDDGLEVRLAGIEPPHPARGSLAAEPFFEEARDALEALALGRRVDLAIPEGQPERDRWGRAPARVVVRDVEGAPGGGLALNRELLARGLARVRPEFETDAEARALLALEDAARRAGRGLWASPYYAPRPAEAITLAAAGSFQIVEGAVVDAAFVRGWIYVNFGPDWRTDFTAGAPPEHADAFDADAMTALIGARVRVRGDVERYNGPFVRLFVPAQVERLG